MSLESALICYLDDPLGAKKTAEAITQKYAVVHYGATYGIAFDPQNRLQVAKARREDPTNLATVSLVAGYSDTIQWIDKSKLYPQLQAAVEDDCLRLFEQVCFIRFPVNNPGTQILSSYCINEQSEIQVFPTPDTDPIIVALKQGHNKNHYAVRSSNVHGEPEKYTHAEALKLTEQINALALAVTSLGSIENEKKRERTMSQPIVALTSFNKQPTLLLSRAGNTHPETILGLAQPLLSHGVNFLHREENPPAFARPQFKSRFSDPLEIKSDILKASGLS